jgi:hypothetical protein
MPADQDAYDAGVGAELVPVLAPGMGVHSRGARATSDVDSYDEGLRRGAAPAPTTLGRASRHYGSRAALFEAMEGYEDAADLAAAGDIDYTDVDAGVEVEDNDLEDEPPGVADVSDAELDDEDPVESLKGRLASNPGTAGYAGRHTQYRETFAKERSHAIGIAPRALSVAALDIPEKVRILRVLAREESGEEGYAAVNPDGEFNDPSHPAYQNYHVGLSWGLIQFTQRSGALGRVLRAAKRREAELTDLAPQHRFETLFGSSAEELLRVTNAATPEDRVAPVGGALLWEPVWTERFRAAGAVPHFTWAQNEVAVTDYFDPQLRYARWLGLSTPAALAILVDRAIHMGEAGALEWVMRAVGPVRSDADRAAALTALGHADLRAFQAANAPDLPIDGAWSPPTHAAMTFALRNLGAASPIPVDAPEQMLTRLVAAAQRESFGPRVERLAQDAELGDAVSYALA